MSEVHNVRGAIETLLAALAGEASLADGITLQLASSLQMSLSRDDAADQAVLSFDPPPAIHVRRGPIHVRCALSSVVVNRDEVRAVIEGWFDRRWQVVS